MMVGKRMTKEPITALRSADIPVRKFYSCGLESPRSF